LRWACYGFSDQTGEEKVKISLHIDTTKGVIYRKANGLIRYRDLIRSLKMLLNHPHLKPGMRMFLDLSDAFLDTTKEEHFKFFRCVEKHYEKLQYACIAFVAKDPETRKKLLKVRQNPEAIYPWYPYKIFYSVKKAKQWLKTCCP
jgi:hypothetical protein